MVNFPFPFSIYYLKLTIQIHGKKEILCSLEGKAGWHL